MARSNRELLITLGADTTSFSQKVKRAKDLTKELDSNFKLLSSSSRDFENSLNGLAEKQDYLSDRMKIANKLSDVYNERLKEQQELLDNTKRATAKLSKEVEGQVKELKEVQAMCEKGSKEWNDWQKEIDKVTQELSQNEKEVKKYQDRVIALNTAINKNQTEIQKMNAELSETKLKFQMLSRDETLEKMQDDIKETSRQFENAKNSTDGFGNSVQDLTMQSKHYNTQIEKTQRLMDEYSADIKKSTNEMKQMEQISEELTRQVNSLRKELDGMSATDAGFDELTESLEELTADLTYTNRLVEMHKDRIKKLGDLYKNSENSLASMNGKLKQTNDQLEQFGKKTQFKVIENALESVRHEFELMDSKLEVLRSSYVNFENSLIGAIRESKLLKQQTSSLREEYSMQQTAITQYQTKIKSLIEEYDKLGRQIETAKDSLEHMTEGTTQYKETSVRIGEMQREYAELDNEIKEVTNSLREMQLSANNTLTSINNNVVNQHRSWDVLSEKMKNAGATLQNIGGGLQSLGGAMMPLTAGMTALGAGVIATGASFEQSMSKVKALSGATDAQFKELETTARNLGKTTVFSATEASEGLQYLSLAGYSVEESMKALPIILDSAVAGAMELGTASDLATDVLSSLGENAEFSGHKIKDLDQLMNQVASTSTKSNTSMEQLLQAYIKVGGQVENMNIPLSTSNTLLAILADKGIKAEEAGNSLNSILINLTKTGGESAKAMKELGVSAFDADGNIKPVEQTLGELKAKLSGLSEQKQIQLINMIGGKTQAKTLQKLLQGISADTKDFTDHYKNLKKEVEKSVDMKALQTLRKTMEDNLTTDFKKLKSALEEQFLTIFDGIAPKLRKIVQSITDVIGELTKNDTLTNVFSSILDVVQKLIDKFASLSPKMQENIIKFVAWGAILAPIIMVVGSLISGVGSVISVFGSLVGGTGKVVKGFDLLKEKGVTLKGFFTDFKGTIGKVVSTLGGKLLGATTTATGALSGGLATAVSALSSVALPALVVALGTVITSLGENENALTWLQEKWGGFGTFVGGILERLSGLFSLVFGNLGIQISTLGQIIGKIITGQWKEIDDVWEKGTAKLELNTAKAVSNMCGESNKAIAHLRKVTTNDLGEIKTIFEKTFTELPNMTTESVGKVAKSISSMVEDSTRGVVNLSEKNLEILRGTSDSMALLFSGISAEMDISVATQLFEQNLQSMLVNGMTTTDALAKDFQKAGELIEQNLVDGTLRASKNANEILKEFGDVASGNIESGVNDIVKILESLDSRGVETLRGLGTNWNRIFGDINDSSKMTTEEMKNAILKNLEDLGLNTPEKLQAFKQTLKAELDLATQQAGQDGRELGEELINSVGESVDANKEVVGENIKSATKQVTEKATTGAKEGFEQLPDSVKQELEKAGISINEQGNVIVTDMAQKGREGAKAYIDEMNSELGNVSGVATTIQTQLNAIDSVRFGNVTKQLSEINKWLGNCTDSAVKTGASLTAITTVTFGSTTKGLSEIDRWLKDNVTKDAEKTKTALKNITTVTFGATTKGLSEVTKWLRDNVSPKAKSAKTDLQNLANVRFGGVTSSLSSVVSMLDKITNKASSTRSAINRVINSKTKSIAFEPVEVQQTQVAVPAFDTFVNTTADISRFKTTGGFYNPTPVGTATAKKSDLGSGSNTDALLRATLEQNQLLLQLLNQQKPVEVAVNMDGRQVAKASAKYMESEINLINSRKNRLGGK